MNLSLVSLHKAKEYDLFNDLIEHLHEVGYDNVKYGQMWAYAEGDIPLLLIAHCDTAHVNQMPPRVLYDRTHRIMWSPDGLGADDRAGIYAILRVLQTGVRPYVLFTRGEESGGIGAREAGKALDAPNVNFMVEVDRRGDRDACFYRLDRNKVPEAEAYVKQFGSYTIREGSFTDIVDLSRAWRIAGVNLSAGYYHEHTKREYLELDELESTIRVVQSMCQAPPADLIPHVPRQTTYYYQGYQSRRNTASPSHRPLGSFPLAETGEEVDVSDSAGDSEDRGMLPILHPDEYCYWCNVPGARFDQTLDAFLCWGCMCSAYYACEACGDYGARYDEDYKMMLCVDCVYDAHVSIIA